MLKPLCFVSHFYIIVLSVIMLNVVAPFLGGRCSASLSTKKEKPLQVLLKRPIGENTQGFRQAEIFGRMFRKI
jgi:hypothetical protein